MVIQTDLLYKQIHEDMETSKEGEVVELIVEAQAKDACVKQLEEVEMSMWNIEDRTIDYNLKLNKIQPQSLEKSWKGILLYQ